MTAFDPGNRNTSGLSNKPQADTTTEITGFISRDYLSVPRTFEDLKGGIIDNKLEPLAVLEGLKTIKPEPLVIFAVAEVVLLADGDMQERWQETLDKKVALLDSLMRFAIGQAVEISSPDSDEGLDRAVTLARAYELVGAGIYDAMEHLQGAQRISQPTNDIAPEHLRPYLLARTQDIASDRMRKLGLTPTPRDQFSDPIGGDDMGEFKRERKEFLTGCGIIKHK